MANLTASQIIDDFTIAVGTTAEQKYAVRTPCDWFAVQNKHATADLYIKYSDENDTTKSIIIRAGEYKLWGARTGIMNGYDLKNVRFLSGTATHPFSVERFIA